MVDPISEVSIDGSDHEQCVFVALTRLMVLPVQGLVVRHSIPQTSHRIEELPELVSLSTAVRKGGPKGWLPELTLEVVVPRPVSEQARPEAELERRDHVPGLEVATRSSGFLPELLLCLRDASPVVGGQLDPRVVPPVLATEAGAQRPLHRVTSHRLGDVERTEEGAAA
ncbi:hypothetical protein [Cellulosimicrobium cellulans]|uniref:hypothetical protein n=1 Tax=Cellulosimicrobium cellulans TaxID=1710 RepID=UPI0020CB839F|nr:hypothetical protein NMQ07_02485 [Cellulosimicrobium cellulans]